MSARDKGIALHASLWLTVDGENFGGHGRIALLEKIAECGSITQAAKSFGMSYKAAWDAIDKMNNLAGEALVERSSGGKGGGGTRLTPRGAQLIANFKLLEREHRRFIAQLDAQAGGIADDLILLRSMSMKTSARNQYRGTVARIERGAVNDEVELDIGHGNRIVATITQESTATLGLQVGAEAFALVKSSSVIVVADEAEAKFSARNCLRGTIARIAPGAVNSEVVIEFAAGQNIAAIVSKEGADALGLEAGQPASAIFKASSVIIAVPA